MHNLITEITGTNANGDTRNFDEPETSETQAPTGGGASSAQNTELPTTEAPPTYDDFTRPKTKHYIIPEHDLQEAAQEPHRYLAKCIPCQQKRERGHP
mmetsp:Transcript_19397/g.26837  ORF Transcript_19397/g.26837 Transcript_19397/m.26837 type:complete len:98 (+) Transcript_19397:98-391(+)